MSLKIAAIGGLILIGVIVLGPIAELTEGTCLNRFAMCAPPPTHSPDLPDEQPVSPPADPVGTRTISSTAVTLVTPNMPLPSWQSPH